MDFLELAKNRYSERYFDQRPIEQEKLDKILEAGRVVPTACNYQPQHFYLIRSEDGLRKLKTVTHFHYNVPLMILVCYDLRTVWRNPSDRYYQDYNSGEQDASIAPTTIQLLSANPLAMTYDKLAPILEMINRNLPNVAVITMYARTDNIAHKSDEDLKRLKDAGVNDLYIGVECGLNDVLAYLNKGYSADETREQCLRLNAVGISHCDLLMLGTAGKGRNLETAKATAALENEIKPTKILLNTMSAFEETVLDKDIRDGKFVPATEKEILQEEYALLQALELPDTYFWAIHPLDSVGVEGVLKTDKGRMLEKLGRAIETVDNSAYNRVSRRGTL